MFVVAEAALRITFLQIEHKVEGTNSLQEHCLQEMLHRNMSLTLIRNGGLFARLNTYPNVYLVFYLVI